MDKNNNIKMLASHLEQEIKWIKQLNALLVEEKEMLATRQFDRLEELANKKQELSAQLEKSSTERVELINKNTEKTSAGLSLKEFLKKCSANEADEINKLNESLAEQLIICRDLNTVNGQVIANNIHTRQQIVSVLSGSKAEAVSVYTAAGNIKNPSAGDAGHHEKA